MFGIEIAQCMCCGGRLKVIASIEEPELIERILAHRRERGEEAAPRADDLLAFANFSGPFMAYVNGVRARARQEAGA